MFTRLKQTVREQGLRVDDLKPPQPQAPSVNIYTDGSSLGNPGPGGWAFILKSGAKELEGAGAAERATANQMELQAILEALTALKKPARLTIHSDSEYAIGACSGVNKVKANAALIRKVQVLLGQKAAGDVTWIHVPGHAGHPENERCDELAQNQARAAQDIVRRAIARETQPHDNGVAASQIIDRENRNHA